MDSWALDADSVVCMKEEGGPPLAPPPPRPLLYGTPLCRRDEQKREKKSPASRRTHFLRCTSCGRSQRGQPLWPRSSAPLPSFRPSLLTSFSRLVMSLLPPCCGVTDRRRLLLAASPVDTVVMSLSPGSTIGHPPPPPPVGGVTGLQRWGVEGGGGEAVQSLPGLPPLHAPPLHAPCRGQ